MAKTLIEFQDHGQDFLWWVVDENGKVIDCGPFQAFVWCQFTVTNLANLKVGQSVEGVFQGEGRSVKYPAAHIIQLKPTEVSVRIVSIAGYVTSTVHGRKVSCTHSAQYAVERLAEKLFPGQTSSVERIECTPTDRLHSKWLIAPRELLNAGL